ncbi:MAG: tetratricopeptide repeat protein [Myxococcota bacterium]|nr:tetratricopeptide repeat protein [Myxococcota bacterium]
MGVRAESLESVFNSANNAFWNGAYEQAAEHYDRLETLGVRDPALSYNLGTTYARLGALGQAVYHYERALRLDPGHADTHHNLRVIREFLARRANEAGRDADLAPAVTPWRAVLDRFSEPGAALGFLVFHVLLFVVLILRRFISRELPRLSLGVLSGVLAVITAASLSVAIGKWHQRTRVSEAIVVSNGVLDVMEGPASTVKRFNLEEGSRVEVAEEKGDWMHIIDGQGRDGWAPDAALGKI